MAQLVLPLSLSHHWRFWPTAGSLAARELVARTDVAIVCVFGPSGCGKSLFIDMYRDDFALIVDGIDAFDAAEQDQLFFDLQRVMGAGGRVLVSSRVPVAQTGVREEIRSRLLLGEQVELVPPTDEELPHLLQAWAAARQVVLPPAVAQFVLARADRNPATLAALVARLDGASLVGGRPLTVPLVKQVLAEGEGA